MVRSFFLPGAGANSDFWTRVSDQIAFPSASYHFSWPGLGDEPHDPDINNLGDLVALVLSKMEGPSNLIAQSMGGLIAIKTALKAPEKIKSLVLTATSAGLPMKDFNAASWKEEYIKHYPNAQTWIADHEEDLTEELKLLDIPTCLIWGDADPISPVSVGIRLREIMPNAKLHIVREGDHDLAITYAREVAQLISNHLGYKQNL